MNKTGASLLVSTLESAGVTTIFTLSGNQIMPIFDACIDAEIQLIHVRHEAAAVYMAEAWAQLNNEIGVALLTAGPGFANGLSPLYSAKVSESPVLLLSGDSPLSQDSMGAFQELDQVSISGPLTKFSGRPQSVNEISTDLLKAISIAHSDRPGPVHLALPFDLLKAETTGIPMQSVDLKSPEEPEIDTTTTSQVLNLLESAKSPLILTGPALSKTRKGGANLALQEHLGIPVITMENPRGLKDPALGEFGRVVRDADIVLLLGKALDFTLNFGNLSSFHVDCRFLVLDPEPELIDRATRLLSDRLRISFLVDAFTATKALTQHPFNRTGQHEAWLKHVTQACQSRPYAFSFKNSATGIHPAETGQAVQRAMKKSTQPVLICDGGEFGQWSQAAASAERRVINGPSGAIGGGICYAIAAKLSDPDSTVFVLMGDGTAGFHLSEFETAIRYGIAFVAVIGNDSRWNAEHQIQLRDYGSDRLIGCELMETRYDQVVNSLGGYGELVDRPEQLDSAITRAIDSGLAACINVKIEGLPAPAISN